MLKPLARPAAAACLQAAGLGKRFGAVAALQELSLTLDEGEIVAVTGPSGAGKSTFGRIVSGIEQADAGALQIEGREVLALPPQARRVAHMFESFALYPTRTVAENVASPLGAPAHRGRFDAAERTRRVAEVLALTGMAHLRDRLPSQLSGGQKQRVALCRALVQDPAVFVLDEPIGHLDAKLRHQLRGEIRRRQRALRPGTLWLTPDGLEALAVADRVAVLVAGRLQQVDTPARLFARPASVTVARLIGDPAMNVLPVQLQSGLLLVPGRVPRPASGTLQALHGPLARDGRLQLGLRPASLRVLPAAAALPAGCTDAVDGEVYAVEPLGPHTIVSVAVGGVRVRARLPGAVALVPAQPVQVAFDATATLAFDADTGLLLA